MRREPLGVEQDKALSFQLYDQRSQRDFRGIRHPMKHRFTEETAANCHPIQSARQFAFLPSLHRMRVTNPVQILVTRHDLLIDPGLVTSRARPNHLRERAIDFYLKRFSRPYPAGRMGKMKRFQWDDAAPFRGKPFNRIIVHRHRENAEAITLQQKLRRNHGCRGLCQAPVYLLRRLIQAPLQRSTATTSTLQPGYNLQLHWRTCSLKLADETLVDPLRV